MTSPVGRRIQTELTRRDCARLLFAAPAVPLLAAPGSQSRAISNQAMEYRFSVSSAAVQSKILINKVTGEKVVLPPAEFALEFQGGERLSSSDCQLHTISPAAGGDLVFLYSKNGVQVQVAYEAPAGKAYLRKRLSVRAEDGRPRRLLRVELDNWSGVNRSWSSSTADKLSCGSHPIHCETLWAGVEFPAAFNRYDSTGFVLASRPGAAAVGSQWKKLHSTVAGVCETGRARQAFLRYIEDVRLAPPRMVACYNSWWTLPVSITREDVVQLMKDLKHGLYDETGTFFDIVTTDAGWNNRQSIWEIDSKNMANGFRDVKSVVESAGGKMGLWISPSEIYPETVDWEWARKAGYAVIDPFKNQRNHGISLADPEYRRRTIAQLKTLIANEDFHQIKYDGFIAFEEKAHHDLLPMDDSVEPLVEDALELLRVSYETRPGLLTEPTFLNSWANFITPWMLSYGDSVWANAGGDCPHGLGAAPAYREASTTAREYYIFSSLNEVWLPQNALQYFDVVHCDQADGFANHVAMAVGRGRFFLATYINPKFMQPADWRVYASFVQWARKNQSLLKHTEVLPSRVEVGEAYAYAHWEGQRGIVVVRNPSNETVSYKLDLVRTGAPKNLRDAVCTTIYPYRCGLRSGLSATDRVDVALGPWELLYLEILPRQQLKEPVVIGGRWFESNGAMHVAPCVGPGSLTLLAPGGKSSLLTAGKRSAPSLLGKVTGFERAGLPQPEWLSDKDKTYPSASFTLTCHLDVPASAAAKLLILVEFPGREHRPSNCKVTVNNQDAVLSESRSSGHIGGYQAKPDSYWKAGVAHESEWTWYVAEIPPGKAAVHVSGSAGFANPRIGVWAWADTDLRNQAIPATFTASKPELPQIDETIERHGICLRKPA